MKNVLLIIILIISMVFGNVKPEDNIVQSVKVAIFPVGGLSESYLLNLNSNGVLEVSTGERQDFYLDCINFNSDDFLKNVSMKESRKLNNEQLVEIDKLLKQLENVKPIYERRIASDAWKVVVIIDNEIFDFYYYRMDHTNDSLGELINKLIEYSPLKVNLHNWA